ncbi:unnamed protein product [Rhizoctonia solani]|uniref:Uncharacterized protein n=1 Tax=Rhizoctonia solani TaxID=456999 RepID=A0A8H2XPA1_9AGAM|nr:unnamed protein product [Rhizoctonia solani]
MPSARITAMNAAMTALDDAKLQLELVSNVAGVEPADKTERDVAQQLLRRMGQMRSTMVETRKKVNAWKTRRKQTSTGKPTGQKPSKRPKLAQEEVRESNLGQARAHAFKEPDDGLGVLIGTPGFREQIKAELDGGEANLSEWYNGEPRNDFQHGFDRVVDCGGGRGAHWPSSWLPMR